MTKVVMVTTSAGPDGTAQAGDVVDVSKAAAKELVEGGFARAVDASDDAAAEPKEKATGRRAASKAVSGPSDKA